MTLHDILKVAAALAAVLVMIMMVRLGGQRASGRPSRHSTAPGSLLIEATLALDARRRITVVGCRGRSMLILTGGPNDMLLGWLPPPDERQDFP